MLKICICDDNHEEQKLIKKATEVYFSTHGGCSIQLICYDNPMLFLEALNQNGGYDILLLDIFMPGINGIDVAKEIRKRQDKTEVIFLTTSDDFAVVAFSLKAAHYLVKPFTQSEFDEAMDRALGFIIKNTMLKISFKLAGGGIKTVNIDDILYIESYKHVQQLHLKDGDTLTLRESLSSLQEELDGLSPNQFLSPYKGYIVNLKVVHAIERNCMQLYNNESIPVAHRSFKELTDKYFAYAFGGNRQ